MLTQNEVTTLWNKYEDKQDEFEKAVKRHGGDFLTLGCDHCLLETMRQHGVLVLEAPSTDDTAAPRYVLCWPKPSPASSSKVQGNGQKATRPQKKPALKATQRR